MSRQRSRRKKDRIDKHGRHAKSSSSRLSNKHTPEKARGVRQARRIWIPLTAALVAVGVGLVIFLGPWSSESSSRWPANSTLSSTALGDLASVPTDAVRKIERGLEAQYELRDSHKSSWDTEAFNSDAGKQLKVLGKLISHPEDIDEEAVGKFALPGIRTAALRPQPLERSYEGSDVAVFRAFGGAGGIDANLDLHEGAAEFVGAVQQLADALAGTEDIHVKFKIISVEPAEQSTVTEVYYLAAGRSDELAVQQNATWKCTWVRPTPDALPLLASVEVKAYEEIRSQKGVSSMLLDCTEAVLAGNRSFQDQLLPGVDTWRARMDGMFGLSIYGHNGLAIGDVNGDGLDDIYVCQPGGLPNRLFVQNLDGTASDKSADAGVDHLDPTKSALLVDLDNDGDQDLVFAQPGGLMFMANDGKGQFTFQTMFASTSWTSLSAADYDLDGDLDIYGCRYLQTNKVDQLPKPYHDANNGPPNVLLQNDGQWHFKDVAEACGLNVNNSRYSFAAGWEDYDNDGDVDLYVANDFGRNNLYRNDGGYFVDVAGDAGVEDISAGMSVSWGDYNADGLMDVYVSNMFSSAGNRVSYQRRFLPLADQATRAGFQRHARGNSLFENLGDGTFRDVSVEAGVTMGRWAWGSKFIDLNNDGLQDLLVANGYITNSDTKDL